MNSVNEEKILADRNRKMNFLKYIFILIAFLFLLIAAIKSAVYMSDKELSNGIQSFM